jgi:uncharacterized cupredoxin-like copper-binding protein
MITRRYRTAATAALFALISATGIASAQTLHGGGHGAAGHGAAGHGAMVASGQPGDPAAVTRTIDVTLHDNYYDPEEIVVTPGETVRIAITNAGALVHEFSIATPDMHRQHASDMKMLMDHGVLKPDRIDRAAAEKMMASMGHGMSQGENSVLLEPGQSGELVWTFGADEGVEFACNVPGHYDAGMMGMIRVKH